VKNALQGPSLRIYEKEIPAFVEDELERLYTNIYCSLARISLYESVDDISTFVATAGSEINIIILFRLLGSSVQVVNQQIHLNEEELACFCTEIFRTYSSVRKIVFYALDTRIQSPAFPYPYQELAQIEENIVTLPESIDEYMRRLSSRTRTGILKYAKKTAEAYPSYHFEVFKREQITTDLVRTVICLADMRMEFKKKSPYIGEEAVETLAKLARTHGYISTITIDGKICASNLCFSVGPRHFAQLLAHDPQYNAYALGHQINLQTILHCISLGGKEIWMMGGRSQEKSRFQTRQHFLNSIFVYRSRKAAVVSWPTFVQIEAKRQMLSVKKIVQKKSLEDNQTGRAIAGFLDVVRIVRSTAPQAKQVIKTVLKMR
jgi:hypothetical protein